MNAQPKRMDVEELKVPAHLRPYVDALGLDGAVEFLLSFGGGYAYFSHDPNPKSPVAKAVGVEKARRLAQNTGGGSMRVPTAKPFIAAVFRAKRMGTSEIARRLHTTDVTVRRWLGGDSRQLAFDFATGDDRKV